MSVIKMIKEMFSMNTMTPKDAVEIIRKAYPELEVSSCKDYGADYLVTAHRSPNDMYPFYLVNKTDGFIRPYSIADNPSRYYNTKDLDI